MSQIGNLHVPNAISEVVIVEHETYFFRYTFPIYRALGILILYLGILGLNELFYN